MRSHGRGVNTWKVLSGGDFRSHMVENWYEYYFRLRCYVSSWGVNAWKVLFFLVGIGEIMVENWCEYYFCGKAVTQQCKGE